MQRRLGDRRGRPRFEIIGDLWGTLDTSIDMVLLDVGKNGALVQSTVPLVSQSVHHIVVDCSGLPTPARARVQHVRQVVGPDAHAYYLIGLEFLSVPAALEAQIVAWTGGTPRSATEGV